MSYFIHPEEHLTRPLTFVEERFFAQIGMIFFHDRLFIHISPVQAEEDALPFLMLQHFNTIPHVVVTRTIKLFLLLLCICKFSTLVNRDVNVCIFQWS